MAVTVLRSDFEKRNPNVVNYRSYRNFNEHSFREQLKNSLQYSHNGEVDYDTFKAIFMEVLNLHAPMKKKYIRGNNAPFMNKTLSHAFMHRSKLKNKMNKNPTETNKKLYNKQRNFCVSLLRREKKKYYNNLDLTIFNDNRKFWQRVKPLFSDKQKSFQRDIILVENEKITSNKQEVAEKLNNFFIEAVENLDIESYLPENINNFSNGNLQYIIDSYANHPSIIKIKENMSKDCNFSFQNVSPQHFENAILQLDIRKSSPDNDIPSKILIKTYDIVSEHLSKFYNIAKTNYQYPTSLKVAQVVPIHKKDDNTVAKNYRPVSLIPVVSKLFERNMYNEIIGGESVPNDLCGIRDYVRAYPLLH